MEIKGVKIIQKENGSLKTKETIKVSFVKKKKFNLPLIEKKLVKLLSENVSFKIEIDRKKKAWKGKIKNRTLIIGKKERILSPDNLFDILFSIVNNKKKF